MGYDDFDRALIDAWARARERFKDDPAKLERILRRRAGPTYTRPLRSWSLVLRANDKRIDDDNTQGIVQLDADRVRAWCSPVAIDYPGVSLDEAARRFGVNRTTVATWASPKDQTWWQAVRQQIAVIGNDARFGRPGVYRVAGRRLMIEHELNRANPRRSTTRVWTPGAHGLDPGGEVWSPGWGTLRVGLARRLPTDFGQALTRIDRGLSTGDRSAGIGKRGTPIASRVMQWVCPPVEGGCGRWVYKLFLPMPSWTLGAALGESAGLATPRAQAGGGAFVCQQCAALIYESAERTASPGRRRGGGRRRINPRDRLVKRMSNGVLSAADLDRPSDRH